MTRFVSFFPNWEIVFSEVAGWRASAANQGARVHNTADQSASSPGKFKGPESEVKPLREHLEAIYRTLKVKKEQLILR